MSVASWHASHNRLSEETLPLTCTNLCTIEPVCSASDPSVGSEVSLQAEQDIFYFEYVLEVDALV